MVIIATVLQVLTGAAFLANGGAMLAGVAYLKKEFARYGHPQRFRVVTGTVEVIGASGMLVGIFVPGLAALGGLVLAATMIGAVFTRVRIKDPVGHMAPAAAMLVLALVVVALRLPSLLPGGVL